MTDPADIQCKTGGYQWVGDTAVYKNRNNQNMNYQKIGEAAVHKRNKESKKSETPFLLIFWRFS